jgi:hypothetical protein
LDRGDFRNNFHGCEKGPHILLVAKLNKEKKRNHEDDEAGNAGNDHRGCHVHPDPEPFLG